MTEEINISSGIGTENETNSNGNITQKKQDKSEQVKNLLLTRTDTIQGLLPKHVGMDVNRLTRLAMVSMWQTPKLALCTPESILGAVLQAAQLGLEPDGLLGHAYIIPYKMKKGGYIAQLQIGYKGMISIANRSAKIKKVIARVAYENDSFEVFLGCDDNIKHIPEMTKERGKAIAVYAIAYFDDGGYSFDVLSIVDVENARNSSQQKDGEAWKFHWPEMARKTAVRRLFKYLPISIEMTSAVAIDELGAIGKNNEATIQLMTDEEISEGPAIVIDEIEDPKALKVERVDPEEYDKTQKGGGRNQTKDEKPVSDKMSDVEKQEILEEERAQAAAENKTDVKTTSEPPQSTEADETDNTHKETDDDDWEVSGSGGETTDAIKEDPAAIAASFAAQAAKVEENKKKNKTPTTPTTSKGNRRKPQQKKLEV